MSDGVGNSINMQQFPAGSVLIPEGGKLNTLFVLREGTIEVSRDGLVISTLNQPGAIFGEMSVLLDAPHSATVRALTPVDVFVITDAVNVLALRPHLMLQLARLLARRVQATTDALVAVSRGAMVDDSLVLSQETVAMLGDPTV